MDFNSVPFLKGTFQLFCGVVIIWSTDEISFCEHVEMLHYLSSTRWHQIILHGGVVTEATPILNNV